MPPVAIAAAVIAGAGAAAAGVTLATAVAIASVAFSVTAALTTKTPSFDSYASPQERKQVLRAAAAPKLAIYGEVMGSGVLFFAEEQPGQQDQDELLHMCIAIAGHEIDGIGQIYLNDEPIESFGEYVTWELHNNRQAADPFLLENCPSWSSDMIGKGIAFLRISLKFNADKFPNGIPNIKLVKRGYKVLDPRTGTTAWSANSALVYLHYLKNFCDVKDADILIEQFKSCANICDELVSTSAGTGVRYRTHGEFDFNESRTKVMEALLLSCAGDRVYTGGKHGMMVGAYQGPATLELHSRQVVGDIQITPEAAERDRFNTYKGKFINAKEKWVESDFPPVQVSEWVTQDGKEISKDIDFRFVTNEFQAQRICSIKMRRTRVGSILQVPMNYSGFSYRPGMNIKVFIPELAIEGVEYRVDSWSFSVLGGVKLILIQDNVQMYGDIPGQAVFQPPITNLPSSGPPAPSNLRYTARPVGDVVQGLLSWENFGNQVADNVVNIYRSGVLQYTVRTPANECILSGLAVGTYEARVQAIAANGVGSPISALSFTIAVPAAPNSITFIPANWSLQLIPNFSTQLSFGTICEFFYSEVNIPIGQVEATAVKLGMGTTLMHSGLKPDTTYYYWVRSINAYGKSAFFAASGKTSYDAASILDILDGEIGAEHLREDLRTPIELIPDIVDQAIPNIIGKLELVERDFTDLSETVAPIAERVPVIDRELTGLGSALAALDERATQTESLLRDEQDSLGQMGIGTVLQQDKLHGKIDRVQEEMGDLRDAIFTVNPESGQIEMDVVRALRNETQASFTEVNQTLDAVTGTLATKADHAVVNAQGERLTEAEQVLDGINAKLTQTVTKSEFTSEQQRLTEVSSSLDAAKGEIQQKAAQSTVTAQGERLAAAEQRITVNSDAQSALAERVSGLKAELEAEDRTLLANITEVARVSTEADQVLAQRVSGVEVRTGTAEGKILALEQVVEDAGGLTAGRLDEITAAIDLTAKAADHAAEAAIANALAGDKGEQRHRTAEAGIRRDQQVQLGLHQALASEVTDLTTKFEGEQADTAARLTVVREVIAGVEQSTARELTQLKADYQAADRQTNAALEESSRTLSEADSALSERVTQLQAKVVADDQTLNAAILETQRTQAEGDQALAEQIGQLETSAGEQAAQLTNLGKVVSDGQQATGEALQQLATKTDNTKADVGTLSEAVAEQGKALAAKQDDLSAEVDLTALASIGNTLSDEKGEERARKSRATITSRQDTQADEHQALAREVTQFRAEFEGEQATTSAALTGVREVIAGVEQSTAREISQLITDYRAADSMTTAALEESNRTLSAADQALSERVTQLQAALEAEDQTLNAAILETQRTQAEADQAMAERVTQLQANLEGADQTLNAAILETQRTQAQADSALSERVTQLQAKVVADDKALDAAIKQNQQAQVTGDQALAGQVTQLQAQVTNGDTALSSAIQQTQQAQVAGDKANADAITTVQAKLNTTTAAVQTVASAVADLEGDVEAGWYTKAQINGEGGGFGLSVKMNADGSMVSSFVVDADVFAVLSRAGGVGTKRHPFVIKNGTVYMNHALMDTAEIGNVIAKYIKVTNLSAVTIDNSDFKGGNAGFGLGGPYSGWGVGWHTIIYNDGRIYTNKLYAAAGSFTGEVNANSGTFNNVVMRENCTIMGKLKAEQVEGGFYVKRIYGGKSLPDNTDSSWRTAATILVSNGMRVNRVLEISASAGHYVVLCKVESSGSSSLTRTATGHYEVRIIRDGATVEYVAPFSISVSATSYPSSGPREEQARGSIGVSKTAIVPGDGNPHTYAVQFRFVRVGGDGGSGSYAVAGCDGNDETTAQLYISSPDLS